MAIVFLFAGCGSSASKRERTVTHSRAIARICTRFHRRNLREHLDVAMPDNGPALLRLTTRTGALLHDEYAALDAVKFPSDARLVHRWIGELRQLGGVFDAERRAIQAAIPRERQRARQLARIDHMRYAEVYALGRRFRPLQQLALAMRARHKHLVSQLPSKMRKLRERQAHFYMLNAPDSPVAVAGLYTGRRVAPLAERIERLAARVGGASCPPSRS